jgi:predicted PurR-regulated permease PerM
VVTAIFAILPVVGSGLVWGPGALTLVLDGRYGAALSLVLIGVVLVGNVDVVVRPAIFRRFAQVHPLVTLVGAIAGVGYFGLLGILIGPLAVSYFFELIRMYREEYLRQPGTAGSSSGGADAGPAPGGAA